MSRGKKNVFSGTCHLRNRSTAILYGYSVIGLYISYASVIVFNKTWVLPTGCHGCL